jgi:membrane-bound serine protease (ClpP class)
MELLIPVVCLLIGLALIAAEVYLVPGLNVVGVLGLIVIVFGIGYSFDAHGVEGGLWAVGISASLVGATFYALYQSGAWEQFLAQTGTSSRPSDDGAARSRYLGQTGRAVTPLRPTGVAEIGGERVEVVTEGGFIASGSQVRIVAMDRRRFFVRLADAVREDAAERVS